MKAFTSFEIRNNTAERIDFAFIVIMCYGSVTVIMNDDLS